MALPKYTLAHNEKKDRWDLKEDGSGRAKATFDTKADATKAGVLAKAVGKGGGSVKIQTTKGDIQEERTYPRSADPKRSPG